MLTECGCDEVGRGAAVAEIYACACILDPNKPIEGLKDSKQISPRKRERLADQIKQLAIGWCLGKASITEIEQLNVHNATLLAMQRAIEGLAARPDKVYVDGVYLPQIDIPAEAVIKGDDTVPVISAASILAKVARDSAMQEYHKLFPEYGFDKNKGYLTKEHMLALNKFGPCPIL